MLIRTGLIGLLCLPRGLQTHGGGEGVDVSTLRHCLVTCQVLNIEYASRESQNHSRHGGRARKERSEAGRSEGAAATESGKITLFDSISGEDRSVILQRCCQSDSTIGQIRV